MDVTVSDDVPSTVNLYIAPIGLGHLSKTPFYGGIQTQSDGYTKKDPKLRPSARVSVLDVGRAAAPTPSGPRTAGFFQIRVTRAIS